MNIVLRNRHHFPASGVYRTPQFDAPFERLVQNMFQDLFTPAKNGDQEAQVSSPRIDVTETDKSFQVQAELPGIAKEDIKLTVERKRVSIEADVKRGIEKKEGETVIYAERVAQKFVRSFSLPTEVDETQVQAKLDNGILTLTLPKKEAAQAKTISVQ
jgi:HSP20 family protein